MNRDDIAALIARCEAATGPDRELDYNLASLLWGADFHGTLEREHARFAGPSDFPLFTASIDAARTFAKQIVPEAIGFVSESYSKSGYGHVILQCQRVTACAATEPLAIIIAALQARLAMENGND